ncbi:Phenylalanyl-tRNA synthetase alpha chain [Thermogutta terrifontis]|uniref:Phenylalanine--tRNA ligase alpha subunit n=1 Tax=Thermogutta terrifontis TaxID=1331910 RepID=A0A286RC45_9BACT|nr:phenylalanine--tRNA ligase subunit alpha [Thermogutta terrifontis]ASV73528.1 Phenylalanyl-tRNA synthetase alpha chain [Thermogutta terrifontis]
MDDILQQLRQDLDAAQDSKQLEQVRIKYLGRKGLITTLAKSTDFSRLSPEEKRSFGQRLNTLKSEAERLLAEAAARIQALEKDRVRRIAGLDLSLPSIDRRMGSIHPIALVQMELEEIFQGMGFRVLTGYEVELEYYNFDALNIPPDHPARDMQDTFWLENGMLLRTHTSANQVRALETYGVPLRAIFPGRCFRNEAIDASHENTFYQLEGLLVDRDISVAHLIAVMKTLLSQVFRREVTVRLRPGFFPFVEPGFELDVQCLICGGKGCSTCKQTGWIELIPCGLVHPKVLEYGRVDPQVYSGFAFGMGLTRLAMMKYGIPDIRLFNSGDIRFYEQFPAAF